MAFFFFSGAALGSSLGGSYFCINISFFFSTSNTIGLCMVDLSISASLNCLLSESTDKNDRILPVNSGQNGYRMIVETLIISKVVYKMVSSCDWSVMDQNLLSLRY